MTAHFRTADRLAQLPPYLFAEVDRRKAEAIAAGVDVIDFGVGDPDRPTPRHIIDRLCIAAYDPANHRYPSYTGMLDFRRATARWYDRTYGVPLDPETEVLTLIGSKEGIAHLPLATVNPGDPVLIPEPCYPVYYAGTVFAGGTPVFMPLLAENRFLPDLDAVDPDVADRAPLMFLNYPNNPTGATADAAFLERAVAFADEHDLLICQDAAYAEVAFDGYKAPSILAVDGGRDVAIEITSLSKTYNMTGWRIAAAAGSAEAIAGLGAVKTNVDSGAFQAVQFAAITAMDGPQASVREMQNTYKKRRDVLVSGLRELGWEVNSPVAGFYVWARVPAGTTSAECAARLIDEAGIVVTPGNGFGPSGEGYVRMCLTVDIERVREAVERFGRLRF
jgi:LL-diaminopimelate aminotransferase